jgi:ubiquinone/menaquinone biosynthesis C-methylase UbiE
MKSSRGHKGIPQYDPSISAYQRAFQADLSLVVASLPLHKKMCVLDVPCGNGFYSRLLAGRLGSAGMLDCVDLCDAYLARTRKRLVRAGCCWETHEANAYQLPFPDYTFDLVWCAQSLISLKDALTAVQEMTRVLRPGGTLAVMENDIFHHILLPWPVDLEAPIQKAIRATSVERFGSSSKLAPVRRLPALFEQAGLHECSKRTFAADRRAPWSSAVRQFLEFHVQDLRKLIRGHLARKHRTAFRRFANPQRSDSLFGDKAMDVTCLNVLYQAKKAGSSSS